jgi:DNA modification methylase
VTVIPDTLEQLRVPVSSLKPYGRNPRKGDVKAIAESLQRHGQYRPIVVNARTQEVLAGNHTLRAARELGWEEIAATFVDVDDDTAARIVLVDNRSNDVAGYDDALLAQLLGDLPDLDGTGYQPEDLDALLSSVAGATGREGTDTDPIDPPAAPRSKLGDLYALGEHRLLCGDARRGADVARLLDGAVADAMWTDPPYGVRYVGKTDEAMTIVNDDAEGLEHLLTDAFAHATNALKPGAVIYIAHQAGALSVTFGRCFLKAGWRLHQTLVWVKDTMVLGHTDYHYRHEPILYGYTPGEGRRGRSGDGWYGDNSQTSVLEFDRPKVSREHPTAKPVALIEHCLRNSSAPHLVFDPFSGGGTTLIAADNLGRRCRAMELDPGYVDVIVDRWERHCGGTAELVGVDDVA